MSEPAHHGIRFEPAFNFNTVITIVGLLIAGLVPFYTLRGDVLALGVRLDTEIQESTRLRVSVEQINQLILARAPDRYTRQDAAVDREAFNRRLDSMEVQLRNLELSRAALIERLDRGVPAAPSPRARP